MNHRWLESKVLLFGILVLIAISIGGAVEIIPMFLVAGQVPKIPGLKPYSPLELEGRDIYIREGCYLCHSQMIRPFRSETERYGPYSKAGEFVYDHPFQWGSERQGPDLARVGGKYPDSWHYMHMRDPRSVSPGSIMPDYPWLYTNTLDVSTLRTKMRVLRELGVPYTDQQIQNAPRDLKEQADQIVARLKAAHIKANPNKEIVALIAYLQDLGTDIHWRHQGQGKASNQ